jgi:hypothetical protein
MTADLIAGDGGPDGSFRVLPYKMDGLADGIPNDKAEVDVTELEPDAMAWQVSGASVSESEWVVSE